MSRFLMILLTVVILMPGCEKDDDPTKTNPPDLDNRSTGASANELLSADDFDKLIVEIDYMPGYQLQSNTVENLKAFLGKYLNKPEGIEVKQGQISSRGVSTYTMDDIHAVEENNRSNNTEGRTIAVHVQVVDAPYDGNTSNSRVLGIAFKNTSLILFGETLHDLSDSPFEPGRDKLETTVLNHEFGHIMGLVDIGTPMQDDHKDHGHGAHCENNDCLMHYTAETDDVVNNLLAGGNVPGLDADCEADLKGNGGK